MVARSKRLIRGLLLALLLLILAASLAAAESPESPPQRIISLSPSTTEILFALGMGDRVVGVTRYCDYPAGARTKARVGGYMDPNYEEIMALKPDLVILLTSHRDAKHELDKMGIRTLMTPHKTLEDIHESIRRIGRTCGVEHEADAMVQGLDRRKGAIQKAVQGKTRPRVLICIGRDTQSGQLAGMYMAGRNNFYDEIIETAGGVNAYAEGTVAYPQISAEGVIELDPDVMVDLVDHINPGSKTSDQIARQWNQLQPVKAVRQGQVHVVVGTHALRPGPRYIQFLEKLARLLHPEVFQQGGSHD